MQVGLDSSGDSGGWWTSRAACAWALVLSVRGSINFSISHTTHSLGEGKEEDDLIPSRMNERYCSGT